MGNKFEIKDLNLYYGDYHALKNINMNLAENEITALSDLPDVENQQHFV